MVKMGLAFQKQNYDGPNCVHSTAVLVHGPLLLFWAWNGGCFTNGNGNDDYKAHTTDATLRLNNISP